MRYYITGVLIVVFDQISKILVRSNMAAGDSISLIGNFLQLTYVKNTGAAFNMFSGQKFILIAIPVIAIAAVIFYVSKNRSEHPVFYYSLAMIVSGGIGNLIDRAVFGFVTDMIDVSFFPPVFNIADIGVTCGCLLLIIYVLAGDKIKKNDR